MAWTQPKLDWKESDYFTFDDFQRIINNVYYLRDALQDLGLEVTGVASFDTTRGNATIPYVSTINALEQSIRILVLSQSPNAEVPVITWFPINSKQYTRNPNYLDWLRWEQQLQSVMTTLNLATLSYVYSNEFYSEEIST